MSTALYARSSGSIRLQHCSVWVLFAASAFLAVGCSDPDVLSADDLNEAYEAALAATQAPVAALLPAGSHAEQAALERLENYFAAMTVDSVAVFAS